MPDDAACPRCRTCPTCRDAHAGIEIPRFEMSYAESDAGHHRRVAGQQEQLAEFFGVKEGVLVRSVNKGSAAEKAGIKAGDVIIKVDEPRSAARAKSPARCAPPAPRRPSP